MRQRRGSTRCAAWIALAAVLLLLPSQARADDAPQPTDPTQADPPPSRLSRIADGAAIGVDLLVARPLLVAATAVGAGLFVPVAIVSAPQGRDGLQEAWEMLVSVPAENAFRRPLGEF